MNWVTRLIKLTLVLAVLVDTKLSIWGPHDWARWSALVALVLVGVLALTAMRDHDPEVRHG